MNNKKQKGVKKIKIEREKENEMALFMREMWMDSVRGELSPEQDDKAREFFAKEQCKGLWKHWWNACKAGLGDIDDRDVFAIIRSLPPALAKEMAHRLPDKT